MFETIVVGTDGSERAARAVEQAAQLAEACGATLHVVHAYQGTQPGVVHQGREIVDQVTAGLGTRGIQVRGHAVQGHPADALLNFAYDASADVIVIGNRGMTGTKARILGSVPNSIAHDASCAVLIVTTDAPA
jgi:nucleotide-binding universal stress UspA family protein